MRQPAVSAARGLIDSRLESFAELWIREFKDDVEAHDDKLQEQLERDFIAAFVESVEDLTDEYGPPARLGEEGDDSVQIGGVFRFAIWRIRDNELWLAAAHEDRELPYVLLMGCAYCDANDD
jgi:hypothetical protein